MVYLILAPPRGHDFNKLVSALCTRVLHLPDPVVPEIIFNDLLPFLHLKIVFPRMIFFLNNWPSGYGEKEF
jgi:hypothetical protein